MKQVVSKEIFGKTIIIETGRMARQASGSVLVTSGGTVILATATVSSAPREGADFFPLTVDYIEKMYASGKIPGGFFKRESKPSTVATLTSRLIDRPIRPLFPEGFRNDVHIVITVLSYDGVNTPDVLGMVGASAALSVSKIPFAGPAAGVIVGYVDNEFIMNPSPEQLAISQLDLAIAGTKEAVTMVEAGAKEVSEKLLIDAIEFGHNAIKEIITLQEELVALVGQPKMQYTLDLVPQDIAEWVNGNFSQKLEAAIRTEGKQARYDAIDQLQEEVLEAAKTKFGEEFEKQKTIVKRAFHELEKAIFRKIIINDHVRADGRKLDEIRALSSEVGVLPCTHGSALFTRGETQSLAVTTLGTAGDEQTIDGLDITSSKKFFLHYNFPPFSVGETGFMRGPGRRELGHGALAERAIMPVLPQPADFPYTIRLVSEILESNGSSSMASVCGGILSLMDAGVPIVRPVAGVAMGLIKDNEEKYAILTDIMGLEDHLGDMDFKVCGTKEGVTALQMDIKILGVTKEIMQKSLAQAETARMALLDHMVSVIDKPRDNISSYAPRIVSLMIPQDKIGLLIGPGGKTIKGIIEETGVEIDIADDGRVMIASVDENSLNMAKEKIFNLVRDVEVGEVYNGKVVKITNFGAFVEVLPGKEGLLHISQISERRLQTVEEVLHIGDRIRVKVKEIDNMGRVNLTARDV
ncbi:MAG TPA: polyribonucleotide nucleotidyltransferase [Candidatus Margulisbacteria bacterium]|nr:MAG: polyribonucleotide nucleotidyltransferase [Candidatus Margulisbacteria bacterium GWD2_39_127]OGI10031.1 MAG: polyribonucleotide nucleotidyltransferase [Candidatus Margulisbacteria bacterium GWE2_39_32]HAR61826.1 polyribonucleotide nucleotidyltransferase [Candidatus Margulisiibacteriota bacterium]HCT84198.1 polyribonucleotide nucleotidyltransferase [Candidatus Margulisiibacteriota bacterium]